jgi:orotidine-5'-phosphate decarboxylase
MRHFDNPIFCALDTTDLEWAVTLAHELRGHVGGVKIGMEFHYAHGADGFARVAAAGLPVFLDLKLHDIPNTVAGGINALAPLKAAIVNVHASGGPAMMRAAAEAAHGAARPQKVIAVTILTSLDGNDLARVGFAAVEGTVEQQTSAHACQLAVLAAECGLDGVVCSSHDLKAIRERCGADFLTVVPGIRPSTADVGDQKRVATPAWAVNEGADILVIGRPITRADDPVAAADAIIAEIAAAPHNANR